MSSLPIGMSSSCHKKSPGRPKRSQTTRFLTQPEPVLNEPGLKNPQASKIKNRSFLPLKMNRFQNKPQASKIRGLQKVGFLGNNGQNFRIRYIFYLLETKWNIQSLRSSADVFCQKVQLKQRF